MHVISTSASVASGLRALTCFSLLRFRKRKNLTILTIIQFLQVFRGSRGGGSVCPLKEEKCKCRECFLFVAILGVIFR